MSVYAAFEIIHMKASHSVIGPRLKNGWSKMLRSKVTKLAIISSPSVQSYCDRIGLEVPVIIQRYI